VALIAALGAVAATGADGGDDRPPAKPLAEAIASSLDGQEIEGLSARVTFTNEMLESAGMVKGADPIMGGGSGRLWASDNGDVRIELQSEAGDVQIVARGDQLWLYHAAANTVYRTTMEPEEKSAKKGGEEEWPPSVAAVSRMLSKLGSEAVVSGAIPSNVASKPAYSTQIEPKDEGGLIGGADVTWDASNGAPLRVAIFARGENDPTLAIETNEVSFGAVDDAVFAIQPPASAKVENMSAANRPSAADKPKKKLITGLSAARAGAPFELSAPAKLAGLPRSEVMLVGSGDKKSVTITYGEGLGAITVIESALSGKDQSLSLGASEQAKRDGIEIPTAKVPGAEATVFGTPLGSLVSFTRDGVRYVVIGSVTEQDALAAARGL
jgi:outer membrane lipoprotein-sorting protein